MVTRRPKPPSVDPMGTMDILAVLTADVHPPVRPQPVPEGEQR